MPQTGPDAATPAEQAAAWLVRISGDDPVERARSRQGFADWKSADPRHAQAAARIEAFIDQVQAVRYTGHPMAARAALGAAAAGRRTRLRRAAGVVALLLAVAVPGWLVLGPASPGDLLADVRSGETDWIERTLPDGSRITLSGDTAVDLQFDAARRTVTLRHGDIRLDVAKDATRPFAVVTPVARIVALGTRFSVSHDRGTTGVEMFESRVSVQPLAGPGGAVVVRAGERLELSRQGAGDLLHLDAARVEDGWRRHQLVLNDRPLPEVLAQLARHRPGGIRYDADRLQDLRVSAVLPLDKPDKALALLQIGFPELRLRTLAGRWVWVGLADEAAKK